MTIHPLESEQLGLQTLTKRLIQTQSPKPLAIGIPKESSEDEKRVSITPAGIGILSANGHHVIVEHDAGKDAGYQDVEYAEAGATLVETCKEVFDQSTIISKVGPPTEQEMGWIKAEHVLLSAVHLGSVKKEKIQQFIASGATAIGYEYMRDEQGDFPLVRMMHEITGSMAVQIAAHYLETNTSGAGLMLGGISGVPPATVVILGAGITGEYAARTALGYGAQVFVLDDNLRQLRRLENALDRRIITAAANLTYLSSAIQVADVVIGAAMKEGERASVWVSEEMVAAMKPGSVIVDTVIDQGGCIATSDPTTHSNPVFSRHGVVHYCVPNIPSNVARTATQALSNVITPTLLSIGDAGGIKEAVWQYPSLRNGTYVFRKHLTKKSISELFGIPYREVEGLLAIDINN